MYEYVRAGVLIGYVFTGCAALRYSTRVCTHIPTRRVILSTEIINASVVEARLLSAGPLN